MAKLTKEQYLAKLQTLVGEDTSEEAIATIEDFTDTFNELETAGTPSGENWEQKYKENDEAWRTKYRDRFFNPNPEEKPPEPAKDEPAEDIHIDDLFK